MHLLGGHIALNKNVEANNIEKMEIKENKNSKNMNDYIRVPTDRLQKNFDVISEIFLIRNQMRYLVEKYAAEGVYSDLFFQDWEMLDNSLRKSIGELEGISMSMRMTPIKSLLRRMEKTIRSYLETSSDKDIRVEIEGEDVEIDKKIIDSLAEPLIHLTRNAMDHGIETKQERKNIGKDPLRLSLNLPFRL
jgi:two-component system chemotaxis sensor kinase CheA